MKLFSRAGVMVSSVLLASALAGCAAPHKTEGHVHSKMEPMDMQSRCERHKKMMAGKSPAEQQTMMQEHMKSMAPEMRERMQAMHEQCK